MHYFDNLYYLGIVMIIVGIITRYASGERTNPLGYKTPASCKNSTNWKIANRYSGGLIIICGTIYTVVFYILDNFFTIEKGIPISILVFITIFMFIILATEIHLRKVNKQ